MGSNPSESGRPDRPSPLDFDKFLPWASTQYQAAYTLIIIRTVQTKYVSTLAKEKAKPKPKSKIKTPTVSSSNQQVTSDMQLESKSSNESSEINAIYIETTYDESDELVRLKILKTKDIPRLLFQIIGVTIPFHKALSSLIISNGVHADGIYEISKYFSTNHYITEISLDGTHFPEANYHILLDNNVLKHLSLSKCNITDDVVKTIASKLNRQTPASRSLSVLNLSTNRITDVGANYLAEILRTNRQLSYLNLADNKITDEGAKSILSSLTKFALTREEILHRSKCFISYIKKKNELTLKTIKDLQFYEDKKSVKKRSIRPVPTKKKLEKEMSMIEKEKSNYNMEALLFDRAETIAVSILGPFNNPFDAENTETGEGESTTYCFGNNTLSYLNLAFNDLTYCSVKRLCDVLKSQNLLRRKPKGLINIRIEGNYIPASCREFQTIDDMLMSGLSSKSVEPSKKRRASSADRSS